MVNEIDFLKAMVKDLENHIKTIKQRINKLETKIIREGVEEINEYLLK